MKKIATILGMLVLCMGIASAWVGDSFSTKVVQKDPTTWEPIADGYSSTVYGYQTMGVQWKPCKPGSKVKCKTYVTTDHVSVVPTGDVAKKTAYTLIYYGYGTHNDEYPYATCIASGNSGKYGYISFEGDFAWSKFVDDGIDQKFWVVKSSDVNCKTHKLTTWNPANYLFEEETI